MGNNPFQVKRVEKARDPTKAKEVSSWLSGKSVKKGASEGNPVTLGRIAKAYAPVLLAMRLALKAKLRVQVTTSTPIEQCDIAFLGYDGTKQCGQSRDFCERFGVVLTKANPAYKSVSDDDIQKRNRGFADIAKSGLDADPDMRDYLNADALPAVAVMMRKLHAAPTGSSGVVVPTSGATTTTVPGTVTGAPAPPPVKTPPVGGT